MLFLTFPEPTRYQRNINTLFLLPTPEIRCTRPVEQKPVFLVSTAPNVLLSGLVSTYTPNTEPVATVTSFAMASPCRPRTAPRFVRVKFICFHEESVSGKTSEWLLSR